MNDKDIIEYVKESFEYHSNNIFNIKPKLQIKTFSRSQPSILGEFLPPNNIIIYINKIKEQAISRGEDIDDIFTYVLVHELFHHAQEFDIIKYNKDSKYRASVECDVLDIHSKYYKKINLNYTLTENYLSNIITPDYTYIHSIYRYLQLYIYNSLYIRLGVEIPDIYMNDCKIIINTDIITESSDIDYYITILDKNPNFNWVYTDKKIIISV